MNPVKQRLEDPSRPGDAGRKDSVSPRVLRDLRWLIADLESLPEDPRPPPRWLGRLLASHPRGRVGVHSSNPGAELAPESSRCTDPAEPRREALLRFGLSRP